MNLYLGHFLRIHYSVSVTDSYLLVHIALSGRSVPSDNKPLPGPMLTPIYVAIWRH